MTLHEIAKALGGTVNGKWINMQGPGHSSKDRSLGIKFDPNAPDGFVIKSFADDPDECRAYVKTLLTELETGIPAQDTIDAVGRCDERKRAKALDLFDEAVPMKSTPAERYLLSRGIQLPPSVLAADSLRFHELCPFGSYRFPAMVALVRDIVTSEPVGIHRTALRDDGLGKRDMPDAMGARMMMGRMKGAAVMLEPAGTSFGIAEGIETALSAREIMNLPLWAVLSAAGMEGFPVIYGAKFLRLCADHDRVGIKAAKTCARRYFDAGIEAEIRCPDAEGTDWNEFLQKDWNKWQST